MAIFTIKLALALLVVGVITASGLLLACGLFLVALSFFALLAFGPSGWSKG